MVVQCSSAAPPKKIGESSSRVNLDIISRTGHLTLCKPSKCLHWFRCIWLQLIYRASLIISHSQLHHPAQGLYSVTHHLVSVPSPPSAEKFPSSELKHAQQLAEEDFASKTKTLGKLTQKKKKNPYLTQRGHHSANSTTTKERNTRYISRHGSETPPPSHPIPSPAMLGDTFWCLTEASHRGQIHWHLKNSQELQS